jgi:methyl-accepting chemotaxis protein
MNLLRDELLVLENQNTKFGIIVSMLHIENSIKNYLLSHDLACFDVYNESLDNIQVQMKSLENQGLIQLIEDWIDQAESKKHILLEASHQLKTDEDLKMELAKGQGKYLMDQIRDQIDIYVSVEESLLITRNQELKSDYQYSLVLIFVSVALILFVGLIQVITARRISLPLEKFTKKLRTFDPNNITDEIMFEKETFKEITELSNGYHKLIGELKSSQTTQKSNESNIQSLLRESEQINKELALKSQELAIKVSKLEEAEKKLNELTKTDQLTQVNNRRGFDEYFEKEWIRGIRSQSSMSLLMIDIDLFKNFNDRYGHVEGDNCLKRVASVIEGTIRRPPDMAAR